MIGGEADLRRAEQIASQRNFGGNADYPVQLSIDYQESSNRLSVLLRIILVIPIMLVLATVTGAVITQDQSLNETLAPFFAGGWLFLGPLLMILFRKKYPKWWFDWNLALTRFETRVAAFLLLLRDEYPSTDEEQSVHLNIRVSERGDGSEPVPTHHQVDPGYPSLHCPNRPWDSGFGGNHIWHGC